MILAVMRSGKTMHLYITSSTLYAERERECGPCDRTCGMAWGRGYVVPAVYESLQLLISRARTATS